MSFKILSSLINVSFWLTMVQSENFRFQNVVIDMTEDDNVVSFQDAKKSGIEAIVHRATYGLDGVDQKYHSRCFKAEKAGFLWGAYHRGVRHFGVKQARRFLKQIEENGTYPVMALEIKDGELEMDLKTAEKFVGHILTVTRLSPLIMGNEYLREMVQNKHTILTYCPLWLSDVTNIPSVPLGWEFFSLWKYTDGQNGLNPKNVNGIHGSCSRSLYNQQPHGRISAFWSKHSTRRKDKTTLF